MIWVSPTISRGKKSGKLCTEALRSLSTVLMSPGIPITSEKVGTGVFLGGPSEKGCRWIMLDADGCCRLMVFWDLLQTRK